MKKIFLVSFLFLVGCSKEETPVKKQTIPLDCYDIVSWTDSPSGDYITIRLAPYQYQDIKVKDYRDYMGKTQVCDLTKIK